MGVPISKLNRQHVDWKLYSNTWTKLNLLNVGGAELENNSALFLVRRPKEPNDVYLERQNRFYSQPLLNPVTSWYGAKMFQREPQVGRTGGDDTFWQQFLLNGDNRGTKFVGQLQQILLDWMIFGRSYWLVDKRKPQGVIQSLGDEKAQKLNDSYLTRFSPEQIINWSEDQYGNLEWVICKTRTIEQPGPLDDCDEFDNWMVFYPDHYEHYRAKIENRTQSQSQVSSLALALATGAGTDDKAVADLVSEGPHALTAQNRVPMRRLMVPDSYWIGNRVSMMLKEHLNQDNTFSWSLFLANLAIPVIVTSDAVGTPSLGEYSYMHFKDPATKVFWLENSGNSFTHSATRLEALRQEFYRACHLQAQGRDSSASASGASGYSKELDMTPSNDILSEYGDKLITAGQLLCQDVADSRNEKAVITITGFHFETRPAAQDIAVAESLIDLGVGDYTRTGEKLAIKIAVLSAFEDQDEKTKETMSAEIEAAPSASERNAALQAQQQNMFTQTLNKISDRSTIKGEQDALAA